MSFNNEDYAQDGDYCVLASYAVTLRRLIQTPPSVHDFFEGYCREMKLACDTPAFVQAIRIERLYLADFTAKTKFAGISGYELLLALHLLLGCHAISAGQRKRRC